MARVKGAMKTRARHKKILKLAKGYRGAKSKLYKTANQAVMKSLSYAYRDRKAEEKRVQTALDCSYQCCRSYERHKLQQVYERS